MSSSFELLTNEPVLFLTFSGEADTQLVSDTYLKAVELAQAAGGALYWLVDVRNAGQSASLIASVMKQIVMGMVGASVMPQMNMAFIAQPNTQTDPSWSIPPAGWFTDEVAALHHAHAQMVGVQSVH